MKKFLTLLLFIFATGISVQAQTTHYTIKQEGSSMVIVPSYTVPVQKPLYTEPAKIPFYESKKLPKGANRNKMA